MAAVVWRMAALPLAVLVSLSLFYGLASMTRVGDARPLMDDVIPDFDFLLVRDESDPELIKREKPPEPELIQQPQQVMPPQPTPTMETEAVAVEIDVPDIQTSANIKLNPSLPKLKPMLQSAPEVKVNTDAIQFDNNPTLVNRIAPRYPSKALRRRQEGYVVVEFIVDKDGNVQADSVQVVESRPEGTFDDAVLRAVKRWRYQPRKVDGQSRAFRARQRLDFKLER